MDSDTFPNMVAIFITSGLAAAIVLGLGNIWIASRNRDADKHTKAADVEAKHATAAGVLSDAAMRVVQEVQEENVRLRSQVELALANQKANEILINRLYQDIYVLQQELSVLRNENVELRAGLDSKADKASRDEKGRFVANGDE